MIHLPWIVWIAQGLGVEPELPAGLTDPLHVLDPDAWSVVTLLRNLLLLALVLWLWHRWSRWRSRRHSPAPTSHRPPPPPTPQANSALAGAIDDLRRSTLASGDYRQGCHGLARLLREHGERTGRHPLTVLTAPEIAMALGGAPLVTVFQLLADLRFSRAEPSREDFEDVCVLAKESMAKGRSGAP